ncbi:KGK domain-containing protein [Nostoc sp.]|uniref:KGK domain-containing protein n=1 Tax=Nostoc sp. TaxID=1180 RepID=UPI002FFAD45C
MSGFELKGDDVVSTEMYASSNFGLGSTFKVSELLQGVIDWVAEAGVNSYVKWFTVDGVSCQVLRTEGGGWKAGKLVFRLEFIPDEPKAPKQNLSTSASEPASPLADLRSQLDTQ